MLCPTALVAARDPVRHRRVFPPSISEDHLPLMIGMRAAEERSKHREPSASGSIGPPVAYGSDDLGASLDGDVGGRRIARIELFEQFCKEVGQRGGWRCGLRQVCQLSGGCSKHNRSYSSAICHHQIDTRASVLARSASHGKPLTGWPRCRRCRASTARTRASTSADL